MSASALKSIEKLQTNATMHVGAFVAVPCSSIYCVRFSFSQFFLLSISRRDIVSRLRELLHPFKCSLSFVLAHTLHTQFMIIVAINTILF